MSVENIFSNDSYTEKDFQESYTELVDTIGKLNNKWLIDGEGNESDPGVLLVKCIAGAIDKLSYNTDKNILENFPETLKQYTSARRVFSPVYNMKWYRSAVGSVFIQNNNEDTVSIPNYLMLSTDDNSVIYTITNSGGDKQLAAGATDSFTVTEGRIKTMTIGDTDRITIDNFIDNKLYLDDYNIAQNGIFVEQYNAIAGVEFSSWKQSDNIYVEDWSENSINGGKYFEFKIDPATEKPYLQFVDDLVNKIGDGLRIRYILSSGIDGNISAGKLTQVFASDSEVILQSDNLYIVNVAPILNGKNPETIEEARKNYFKDIDICNTLVTLRDYINAIYLSEDNLVSNCFVCDKNNDVQYSYRINTQYGDVAHYEEKTVGSVVTNELQLYDLKFYGLKYRTIDNSLATNAENYNATFDIINPTDIYGDPISVPNNVLSYIESVKSINHNFQSIRNANQTCMLKDYYTLHVNLLFRQRLSSEQEQEVKNKVYTALLNKLNARAVDFGEKITYEKIQEIIYTTDNRILGASIYGLDDIDFTTQLVYWSPYMDVYYDPSRTSVADLPVALGKAVVKNDSDFTTFDLYLVSEDGLSWEPTAEAQVSEPAVADRQYDLLNASGAFALIYSKDKSWQTEYISALSTGDRYICISQPSKELRDQNNNLIDTIYSVAVNAETLYDSTYPTINYPSSPVKVTLTSTNISNGYYKFNWNGTTYKATFIKNSDNTAYQIYLYDNVKEFFYNSQSVNNIGQFHEIKVNSEIVNDKYDDNFQIGQNTLVGDRQTDIYAKTVLAGKASILDTNSVYHPKLRDQQVQERSGVAYLQPNLALDLIGEYTLKENEYIQILTPELETKATYSFYVYMGFCSNNGKNILSIGANSNYELQPGEFIIFYYRSSDDENYRYTVYNQGNIICPSIAVVLYQLDVNSDIAQYFAMQNAGQVGASYSGICPDHIQKKVVAATTATYAKDRLSALKSQDSCDVKQQVKANVKKYTFISVEETTVGNVPSYTMSFSPLTTGGVTKYYRVIEEGESFWVYDNNNVLLKILGSGSILYKTTGSALNSNGSTIKTATDDLQYVGSEIFQIGPGYTVQPIFGANANITSATSLVTNSSTAYDAADFMRQCDISADQVTGQTAVIGGVTTYLPQLNNIDIITWSNNEALSELIEQKLNQLDWSTYPNIDSVNTLTIEVKYTNRIVNQNQVVDSTVVYFSITCQIQTQTHLSLSGAFEQYTAGALIQYRSQEDSSYTLVSTSQLNSFTTLIRSALMVSIDNSAQSIFIYQDYQGNKSQQSVFGYDQQNTQLLVITNPVGNTNELEFSLSTDGSVSVIGGKQKLSAPMSFYSATELQSSSESDPIQYGETGSIQVNIKVAAGSSVEIPLPNTTGDIGYILFARCGRGVQKFSVSNTSGSPAESACYTDLYGNTLYGGGTKTWGVSDSFSIKIDDGATKFYIYANQTDGSFQNFSINMNLVPFSYKEELSYNYYEENPFDYQAITNTILTRMGELDTEGQYFINTDIVYPIANPIASASFLDSNHPFNKYTICQMNTDLDWR